MLNPLSANPTKCSNILKLFVGNLPTNCLSVFEYFVRLTLKGLKNNSLQFICTFIFGCNFNAWHDCILRTTNKWIFLNLYYRECKLVRLLLQLGHNCNNRCYFNPLSASVALIYIETSQLICCANRLTGFYIYEGNTGT